MSNKWLSFVALSDPYERKARFIPGVISVLPLAPAAVAYGINPGEWITALLSGVGLGAVLAVAISHLASAFGNRLQRHLWPDWPYDSPANRRLLPGAGEASEQQQMLWYAAIEALTGLSIESAVRDGDKDEVRRIINDAMVALRNLPLPTAEGERVRLHNTDYGFARNLTGLRPVWVTLAVASFLACWAGLAWLGHPPLLPVVSTAVLLFAVLMAYTVLPGYVRTRASHYADSLFAAVMAHYHHRERSEQKSA